MARLRRNSCLVLVTALALTGAISRPAAAGSGDLAAVRDALVASAPVGSTLRIDHGTGQVVIRVAGPAPAALSSAVARHGGRIRVESAAPAVPLENLYGGQGMVGGGSARCTTGFMASSGQTNYVITAGHCTAAAYRWTRKGNYLGLTASTVFDGDGDFGLIAIHGVTFHPKAAVNSQHGVISIAGTEAASVGQELCKMGNNSLYTCGTVTGVDVTVVYPNATVNGMIETTICAVPGDSGGPLMTPYQVGPTIYAYGVGILSGGGGSCSAGTFRSYYQPIEEVLSWHGLNLYPA